MEPNITRWRPDTCSCVVDLSWLPSEDPPVLTCVALEPCDTHKQDAALPLQDRYESVLAHNRAANVEQG